jgi:hypothetical protein
MLARVTQRAQVAGRRLFSADHGHGHGHGSGAVPVKGPGGLKRHPDYEGPEAIVRGYLPHNHQVRRAALPGGRVTVPPLGGVPVRRPPTATARCRWRRCCAQCLLLFCLCCLVWVGWGRGGLPGAHGWVGCSAPHGCGAWEPLPPPPNPPARGGTSSAPLPSPTGHPHPRPPSSAPLWAPAPCCLLVCVVGLSRAAGCSVVVWCTRVPRPSAVAPPPSSVGWPRVCRDTVAPATPTPLCLPHPTPIPPQIAQIVLAVLGFYGLIIGGAVAKSKISAANAPVPAPVFPDYHTGPWCGARPCGCLCRAACPTHTPRRIACPCIGSVRCARRCGGTWSTCGGTGQGPRSGPVHTPRTATHAMEGWGFFVDLALWRLLRLAHPGVANHAHCARTRAPCVMVPTALSSPPPGLALPLPAMRSRAAAAPAAHPVLLVCCCCWACPRVQSSPPALCPRSRRMASTRSSARATRTWTSGSRPWRSKGHRCSVILLACVCVCACVLYDEVATLRASRNETRQQWCFLTAGVCRSGARRRKCGWPNLVAVSLPLGTHPAAGGTLPCEGGSPPRTAPLLQPEAFLRPAGCRRPAAARRARFRRNSHAAFGERSDGPTRCPGSAGASANPHTAPAYAHGIA